MPRPSSPASFRSQSGAVTPGLVIFLALVATIAYVLLAAFEADSAHYGEVAIPSEGRTVELPEGEIDVFYAEASGAGATLTLPDGLAYSVVSEEGEGVPIDSRGGDAEEVEGGFARVIGAASVPTDGTYRVTVTTGETEGRVTPRLTFGQSPLQAVGDRFEELVEELKGTTGIIVAVVLIFLLLLPTMQRAARDR